MPVRVGIEKLIQMLPCITMISSTGRPTDRKVNSSTRMTKNADKRLMSRLSLTKDAARSLELVELPTM